VNLSLIPPWPLAVHPDGTPHDRAFEDNYRWYGTRTRRCAPRHLCPDPTALPVQRFLARPPIPKPVPVPVLEDLTFDPVAYAAARRTLGQILEVLNQRRPLIHLRPTLTPHAFRYVGVVVDWLPATARRGDARVLSIRMCQPRSDVAEVAAVCRIGGRPRALAARFERQSKPASGELRWCCAVLQLG
jgi:Family of unknown function (DUF6459)